MDVDAISVSTGGAQNFELNAGVAHANRIYLVVGSLSGTEPGTPLGSSLLPLNIPDPWFDFTVTYANSPPLLTDTLGLLDSDGHAEAQLALPALSPSLAGLTLNHAYLVYDQTTVAFASNAVSLTLVP